MARIKRHRIFVVAVGVIVLAAGIGAVVAASRVSLPAKSDGIPLLGHTEDHVFHARLQEGRAEGRNKQEQYADPALLSSHDLRN